MVDGVLFQGKHGRVVNHVRAEWYYKDLLNVGLLGETIPPWHRLAR